MKAKEKARELFDKMCYWHMVDGGSNQHEAKQCALIAVDEILTTLYDLKFGNAVVEELNSETFLTVIRPVSDIPGSTRPFFSFDAPIFLSWLFLNPVNRSMRSIFLSFGISNFPVVDEWCLGLHSN